MSTFEQIVVTLMSVVTDLASALPLDQSHPVTAGASLFIVERKEREERKSSLPNI